VTQGQLDRALSGFKRAHKMSPRNVTALLSLAMAYHASGHVSKALSKYKAAADTSSGPADAAAGMARFVASALEVFHSSPKRGRS
jgi:Tfp pilus assembly protein PilF